jgi:Flp pilus assembly protein TadB
MASIAAVGAIFGLGVWLIVAGLARRPRPLAELAADIARPNTRQTALQTAGTWEQFAARLVGARFGPQTKAADLAVAERTPASHAVDCLQSAVLLAGLGVGIGMAASLAGVAVPGLIVVAAVVGGAPVGWWLAAQSLSRAAAAARRDFHHALATYLDLVVALLLGGAGVDTALDDAAQLGTGSAFRLIRGALGSAQEHREAPWRALAELGERLDVVGLSELAGSMALAGEHGARVRETLIAKAASLRTRELNDAEADAARASETMTMPIVAMGFGFVLLVCYPPLIHLAHV